jgi:peptidyl-prolyl cis-trans isomerase SurA
MRLGSTLLYALFVLSSVMCKAQDLNNRILLRVDGKNVEAGEFIRMYRKSTESGDLPDAGNYLQQFITFKLKVAEAIDEGFDTTRSFINELKGYREQLAQSYLTDKSVKEQLLQSAYKRSLTEINAWHILINLAPDASPSDTLRAWNRAMSVRKRIIDGESFEEVARSSSDDKSVLINGGNLGYFTAFQMISPFEDASYSLHKDSLSYPVRTSFGYHIIKVADKRPSKGKIRVAHIMKAYAPGSNIQEKEKAEKDIREIYSRLQKGALFKELAKEYSDHRESAEKGGELGWFGAGEIINDFSEAAFSLKDTGSYTAPVSTPYGWHIIKLLEKKPPLTYEESKSFLESRINQSYLASLSRKSFADKLKNEYNYKIENNSLDWFVKNTDTLVISGEKKYDASSLPSGNLYSFADRVITNEEFAEFAESKGNMIKTRDSLVFVNTLLESKVENDLINYENNFLEKKNPEFRYLMNEFHDGILLFEISEKKIWNRVNTDSIGLTGFYDEHKNEYLTAPGINAKIYTLRIKDGEKKLREVYAKFSRKDNIDKLLCEKFNVSNDTVLTITEKKWFRGEDPVIDSIKWEAGTSTFKRDPFPTIVRITELIKPVPLNLESVRSEIMTKYQEYLERNWIEQLRKKYIVSIDNSILTEVEKALAQ